MRSRLHPFIALLVLALLVLVLVPFASAAATDVVISEIMINATTASESDREWVEIYNKGASGVDLVGWELEDNSTSDTIGSSMCLGGSCVLPAGEAWLISPNTTELQDEFDNYSNPNNQTVVSSQTIELGSPIGSGLANSGDYLILRTDTGTPVDCVSWGSSNDCDGLPYPPGANGYDGAPTGSEGQSITNIGGEWYNHEVNASPYDPENVAVSGPTAIMLSSLSVRQSDANVRLFTLGLIAILVATTLAYRLSHRQ